MARTLAKILDLKLWLRTNQQLQPAIDQDMDYEDRLTGVVKKIRIVEILRGTQNLPIKLFYGPITDLDFDPNRYCWLGGISLL